MEPIDVHPVRLARPGLLVEVDALDEDGIDEVRLAEVVAAEVVGRPSRVEVLRREPPRPAVEAALRDRTGERAVDELGAGGLRLREVRGGERAALEAGLPGIGLREVGIIEAAVHEHALDRAREERLPLAVEDEAAEVAVHERAGIRREARERRLAEVDIGDRRPADVDDAGGGVEVEGYVRVPAGTERPGVSWPSCESFGAFCEYGSLPFSTRILSISASSASMSSASG